ncbi:type I polyketide synthase [Synoicihabitans lomoniglobus]|uniref:SDR family NAD(P)-dependent oxidoreductase n=1 Tax=Synoicihabitans lomoniglobus TaxID=2909285 RepID=A0AAF0A1E7_9BACT|nr:SDR family NAD(P)-dependent oxidoreductase [Opitutaceae bacterium LMO-M01]WED65713.1 SDR family NAD(P)-dependent oxidoreductase [Opitutaceae bacterium LMO-M01]
MAASSSSSDQLRRAVEAIRQLKARLAAAEQANAACPVAIVGLGVRFPGGATTPDKLWQMLHDGVDAVGDVPANRWDAQAFYDPDPAAPGKIVSRRGGFLDDVEHFDPRHFGLAPTEAPHLDPQHRLLLETAWEALEHAGLAPDRLAGRAAGVFIGIASSDYAQRLFGRGLESIDPYVGSGNAHSVAAGRIAYTLGLHGPAVAIDTACSSSLVATHLACQSLRTGECELALTGGANLLLSPTISVNHSRAQMLSPDGRCKAFGAAADGFGRAEGCGVIVLKRLADATRDGDRVLAVIRGSATNQDGRTSGLTVPNGQAQQAVIRAAQKQAGVNPHDIDYLEAHGTGTSLGDPIEAHALGAVFSERPSDQPLWVGSIKSNFGHSEAAAGIAGIIKVVLALAHEEVPPHLHAAPASPRIDWNALPLRIVSAPRPWPRTAARARLAGVSSFGFGGTNAHIVLGESPESTHPAEANEPADLLPLSARTPAALARIAADWATYLESHDTTWSDLCHTAAVGRAAWSHRALVPAPAARNHLRSLAQGEPASDVTVRTVETRPRIAFLFSGQGSLAPEIGLALRNHVPAFAEAFAAAAGIVERRAGWDVAAVLADPSRLSRTEYGQVTLFCLSYALARTWQAWGVEPDMVLGHSVGEYAAACVAGVFSLDAALELLIARATGMGELGETGAMVAVSAAASEVEPEARAAGVEIGAFNAPRQVVLTGAREAVTACAASLAQAGHRTVPLGVRQGYHSAEMEPMISAFQAAAERIAFQPADRQFISSVTGASDQGAVSTTAYWVDQIRRPVRWTSAIETLRTEKADIIIEVGPRGLLSALGQQTWSDHGPVWLTSLRGKPGENEAASLRTSAAHAWVNGSAIDWTAVQRGRIRRRLALPTYPFERQRYWCEEAPPLAPAYTLRETPIDVDPTPPPEAVTWHIIGDAPALVKSLKTSEAVVVCHDASASPLVLQTHLVATNATPVKVVVVSTTPQVSLWVGAAKALALEFRELWRGLVIIDSTTSLSDVRSTWTKPSTTPVSRFVDSGLKAPQLQIETLAPATWTARSEDTYLITGGLGALGQQVAGWLIDRGARSLALLGRTPPTKTIEAQLDAWRAVGVDVLTLAADVTDRPALTAALARLEKPLRGVFHVAGVPAYQLFGDIDPATWRQTIDAKVTGARLLDELTREQPIDVFVLFSSIASVWGSQGQAHYAAANQALDDLALRRRETGRPALAVNWGPWGGGGMATAAVAAQLGSIGVRLLSAPVALATLGAALRTDHAQIIVADIDWERFRPVYELHGATHLLAKLPGSPLAKAPTHTDQCATLAERLAGLEPAKRHEAAVVHVQALVGRVLKLPLQEVTPPHTGFADLGVDSLMAVQLRRQLSADLAIDLAATLIFDHPDCDRLARHLVDCFDQTQTAPTMDAVPTESDPDDETAAEAELARKLEQLGL